MISTTSFLINLFISIIIAIVTMLIFDIEKLKYRLSQIFGFKFYKTFERLSNRKQIIRNFNKIFVSYQHKRGGKILLMSNTGGYPEFDPYSRIIELANYDTLDIYLGVSKYSIRHYINDKPEIAERLISSKNIHLYVFDNLIPYQYRIGVNTDLKFGFYTMYYGHNNNKVEVEGIQTNNDIVLGGVISMFFGLIQQGKLVNSETIKETLDYSFQELVDMKSSVLEKISKNSS